MLLVFVVTLVHRPYLEESIYSIAERANMDRLRGPKGSDGPLGQEAARRAGRCLRSWRLGGTQPVFLPGIGSVLPDPAQAAIGRMNEGTAVVGLLLGPHSEWEDGQVRTGNHAEAHGSSQIRGCFREEQGSCPCSGAKPTGSRSEGVRSRLVGAHDGSLPLEVLRDDFRELFLFGEQGGRC